MIGRRLIIRVVRRVTPRRWRPAAMRLCGAAWWSCFGRRG